MCYLESYQIGIDHKSKTNNVLKIFQSGHDILIFISFVSLSSLPFVNSRYLFFDHQQLALVKIKRNAVKKKRENKDENKRIDIKAE